MSTAEAIAALDERVQAFGVLRGALARGDVVEVVIAYGALPAPLWPAPVHRAVADLRRTAARESVERMHPAALLSSSDYVGPGWPDGSGGAR